MSYLTSLVSSPVSTRRALRDAIILVALFVPSLADAYMGQQVLTWAATNILGPLAFLMIIITVVAAFVKPDLVKQAGYTAILAVVLFLLIRFGNDIISKLQAQ